MSRLAARFTILVLAAVVVSCNPTVSGPVSPRPSPIESSATTTTAAPRTSTVSEPPNPAETCPTVFCLVYHIHPDATWPDGAGVTADDFANTVELYQDRSDDASGYAQIEAVDPIDDKTVRVSFAEPYGPWQTLFARVFRDGEDVEDLEDIDTTGPFSFVTWEEGEFLNVVRDRSWWGDIDPFADDRLGDVGEITFVFLDTLEEMVDALEDGEVDVISARPDLDTVQALRDMEGIELALAPGPFWEHIDFHHEDRILSQLWARQAISLAIDREEILDRTVRLMDPTATALDNTVWMANSGEYEAHFEDDFDPVRAEQILVDQGCSAGVDGIYVCSGRRMSFVWASTNDDLARQETFESVREDLESIGIEVTPDFRSPSGFVTREFLFGGPDVWQLVNFSWRAHADPNGASPTYYCDDAGDLNVNRYCSEGVERLVREAERTVDREARAALYNRADRVYLEDVAVIPLYQKLSMLAWSSELSGPEPNFSISTDLWNVASWTGKSSIVVALPGEPTVIDPLSLTDDEANVVLSTLMYGAFGMDPTHSAVPLLVESVDVIEAGE